MSKLAKLCSILHDIEATTSHLTQGISFAQEIAKSGPILIEEMTMHLKWVGNMYTIVLRREALVKDLKKEIHRALNVQPEVQRIMNWNVQKHAQPANDNTSIQDCDFAKDIRLVKIGQTYVRVVKFHFDIKKIIRVSQHLQKSPTYNKKKLTQIYSNFKAKPCLYHPKEKNVQNHECLNPFYNSLDPNMEISPRN